MLADKIWKKIYPRFFKSPCETCITKAVCQNKNPWLQTCDTKKEWEIKKYRIKQKLYTIEELFSITIFLIICALILVTFGFGLWKWWEILFT